MARFLVWEVFLRTTEAVDSRFQKDQRAPTEHALLDDNGDRKGTERPEQSGRAPKAGEPGDGTLARQTVIFRIEVDRSPVNPVICRSPDRLATSGYAPHGNSPRATAARNRSSRRFRQSSGSNRPETTCATSIAQVVVGQDDVLDQLLTALLCRGHALMIGVPGLGKTLMAKSIAQSLQMDFRRIQFTPDLMPSDIIGTDIIEEDPQTGRRKLEFFQGPLFTNFLLADEINRAPPKTQAALLQAMQEQEVSVGRRSYVLDPPFFVIATQNPIEQEGTYPLPEAQLDRFMFNIPVTYPTPDEEVAIVKSTTTVDSSDRSSRS